MDKANKEYYHVRRDTTEQIQEGLEAAQEIKSYNGEAAYCDRLDKQLEIYEATLQRGEFLGAGLVGSAQSILKLGLASVIIAGAYLLGLPARCSQHLQPHHGRVQPYGDTDTTRCAYRPHT